MQVGFYFDQTRCTGCAACQVACKDLNDIPAGPERWISVRHMEEGQGPDIFAAYMVAPCWHCQKPVCVEACPVGAITKRDEDGIVVVDGETCLGKEACGEKCRKACPYDAPQFGPEPTAKMSKCDYCLARGKKGALPTCVAACPTRALDAGPLEELEARHGQTREAPGFRFSARTQPAAVIRPKPRARG